MTGKDCKSQTNTTTIAAATAEVGCVVGVHGNVVELVAHEGRGSAHRYRQMWDVTQWLVLLEQGAGDASSARPGGRVGGARVLAYLRDWSETTMKKETTKRLLHGRC